MKNSIIALACLALVVFFGSCSKSSTCTCVTHTTMNGEVYTDDITSTITVDGDCKDGNSTTTTQGMIMTVTCK